MKVVVACGGTGGHAFPGLAVAEELRRRGHEVTVWDSGRDVESSVMRRWTGDIFSTGAKQLSLKNLFSIARSFFRCRKEMRRSRPDVLLAMGSYSSLPPVMAARVCGVPVVLHEANTVPGRAVEFLSRYAKAVAVSFDMTAKYLPHARTVRTGLPIRADIARGKRFPQIPERAFTVFVTGGSQGAHAVNCLASEALVLVANELRSRGAGARPLYVIHQTGEKDEGGVIATYMKAGIDARVNAFENEMANAFASADIVIARAGASTCFELAACGRPALLIPLPSALRNHQHYNAEAFSALRAADEGIQSELTPHQIAKYLISKCDNPQRLVEMSARIRSCSVPDADSRVADLVEKYARRTVGLSGALK
ncbi:MAG: UDP-N-acetylglucosamine--N-acetylmuramyl-(pentapeptide) pyrophosphoryl-undecaprenol N-acetylglucosamine transferase [Kiritimatiellae bacterium]|nr:UDP-N-acetylglucosamine--N-acetylmuramyl-(pentapeptide) pyrophosphoryl-undecaprenol N-acetylglucosamine transferase [Kiritimatiellia bacterium]